MPSSQEMRRRIQSVKNISQLTRALETVSASKARKTVQAVTATQAYSQKAWQVLVHLASQPGHASLHPLLSERKEVNNILVLAISSDKGLAGSYNINLVRTVLFGFQNAAAPVTYITVGKKGRDMLARRRRKILAEFSQIPAPPEYRDVSAIGKLAVDEYLDGKFDQVYLVFTEFVNMMQYRPVIKKLLPFSLEDREESREDVRKPGSGVFLYEPGQAEILDQIVPRFTALQVYQAILSAQASENAARMVAMRNATDNAYELIGMLELEYNKMRQQAITNDILDIVGGAEAQAKGDAK